jgi:NAD(P)-dependent dehydrogenase (short-subunit alcohol dehydrogenase family)
MYVTKLALELMPNDSKIVFINSVAGLEELENQSIYCASKYGLTAFAGVLGKELKPRNIKVSSIHPGGINTPLWNIHNPYPAGDVNNSMDPKSIVDMIDHIVSSKYDIDYKTVKMFPSIEWHN